MARLFLAACLCWVANSWTSNTHTTRHTTALRTTLRTAPQRFARGPRPLLAKYDEEDLPSFDEYSAQKLRDFLTQRSVQTVIHYFDLGRDTLRRDWLEKYGGHEGIERFHGHGGLKQPSDEYLSKLLRMPTQEIVIQLRRRGAGAGGSPSSSYNPYLKDRFVEYTDHVEPRDIGLRCLRCREDLATEWRADLNLLVAEDTELWRAYFATVRGRGVDADAGAVLPPLGHDPVFAGESTPFRGGNYDLLLSLATDLAATRALRPAEEPGDDDRAPPPEKLAPRSAAFLREFYASDARPRRLVAPGGERALGGAAAFLNALCAEMPRVAGADLVDPLAIAEYVMRLRAGIVEQWLGVLEAVPDENTALERQLLEDSFRSL